MSRLTTLGMNSNLTLNKGANYSSVFYFTETVSSWPANTVYSLYDRVIAKGYRGEQLVANVTINSGVIIDGFTFYSILHPSYISGYFRLNGTLSSITITNNGTIRGYGGNGLRGTRWTSWTSSTGAGTLSVPSTYPNGNGLTVTGAEGGDALTIYIRAINNSGGSIIPVPVTINGTGYIYGGGGGGGGGSVGIAYTGSPYVWTPTGGGGGGGGRGSNTGALWTTGGSFSIGGSFGFAAINGGSNGSNGSNGSTSAPGSGGGGGTGAGGAYGGSGGSGGGWGSAGSAGNNSYNGSGVTPANYSYISAGGAAGHAVFIYSQSGNVNVTYGGSIVSNSLGGFGNT